jgi:hypothetical protein
MLQRGVISEAEREDGAMPWNVYLTVREPGGGVKKELVGAFEEEELPAILERTFRQARREGGGVQVSRPVDPPLVRLAS